jgi:UDP-glucose 4-epimerase
MIIVTGGLGFIGNELVRQLKMKGEKIAIIDNNNRVAPDIEDIKDTDIYQTDIVNYEGIKSIFQKIKPEIVYHLAAIHFIPECNANPERTLRINVEGTQSILRAAAETGVKKVLFASSGAVYADIEGPLTEKSPISPVDIYGYSKLFGENLCNWFSLNSELNITVCRLFNNYGLRETNFHIIPEILEQLKKGDVLHLGNIKPIRDYVHTSDTAKAFIKLAEIDNTNFTVVNIASNLGLSVEDLIEKIRAITQRKITYNLDPSRYRKIDKMVQLGSNDFLKKLTNWTPEMEIETGLNNLLKYEGLI